MPETKFLDRQELVDAMKERGIKTSPRTVDRWCERGMPYWLAVKRRRFQLDVSLGWLMEKSKVERNPVPQRRGRRAA
jgi:transposase-like protein